MVCVHNEPFTNGNLEVVRKEFDLTFASDSSKRDDLDWYSALKRIVYLKMRGSVVVELSVLDSTKNPALDERLNQSRLFKRLALRKLSQRRLQEVRDQRQLYATIASEFLSLPSLDNVDRLSTVYGYSTVRRAISILDNMVFEEFFYGKLQLYPLWIKQFTRLLDAARPRAIVKELMSSQE